MRKGLTIFALLLSSFVAAEDLTLPGGGDDAVDRSQLPQRGTTMEAVRGAHGEPLSASGPVGEPPITRWNYERFSVFFEFDRVINSVIPDQPRPVYHSEELRPATRQGGRESS